MDKKETLCWDCQRAVCGCSWAKKLKPVKGWVVEENKRGVKVLECPLFIEDYKFVKIPGIAQLIGINTRTLYRKLQSSGGNGLRYDRLKLILARFGYETRIYKGKVTNVYIRKRRKSYDIR